jgi:hypothetical protein
MVSMLPGATASVLGVVGITGSSGLAIALAAVAQPLFIASAILVLISALACSRLVAALSSAAVALLYLSMFQLATSTATGGSGSMSMTAMQHSGQAASTHTNTPTFYLGLLLFISSAALAAWRRHAHKCRPLLRLPQLRAARH